MADMKEKGTTLLSATTVALNSNADTTLYTVPTGKRCILSHAILVAGADAGATTTISIGQDGAETDFIPAMLLSNLDAQYDAVILEPPGTLYGSATWDAGSIADGDEEAKEVTVTGAALGDYAIASLSIDIADLVLDAQVTAANTVTCILANNTGGAIDLASATVKVKVVPAQDRPPKNKSYAAATVIQAQVASQSGGATNTLYLYGTLY
jgi:hypothetical protein